MPMSISFAHQKIQPQRIELAPQVGLKEVRDNGDDWTGKASAKQRRKLQNRLHQRAWRRRKAEAAKAKSSGHFESANAEVQHESIAVAFTQATAALVGPLARTIERTAGSAPHTGWTEWREDTSPRTNTSQHALPATATLPNCAEPKDTSLHDTLFSTSTPSSSLETSLSNATPKRQKLIPPLFSYVTSTTSYTTQTFTFPLSPDHHLLTLVQYNVFRALVTNLALCSLSHVVPPECSVAALMAALSTPSTPPPTFAPTTIQLNIAHPAWIDAVPCPRLRDNLVTFQGSYDEDELCEDVSGGLFEGFDDCRQRGWLVWGEPWELGSWEFSEGFVEKWGWLLRGCEDMWRSTNRWREERGEERLGTVWEIA